MVLVKSSSTSKVSRRHALRGTPFAAQISAMNCATAGRVSRRAGKVLLWFSVEGSWLVAASGSRKMSKPTRLTIYASYCASGGNTFRNANDDCQEGTVIARFIALVLRMVLA